MTTGKTTALTRWTFVGKVMSLPFNMLSRLVTAFLPRSKHLLISPSAVILEPKKIKFVTVSIVSHLFATKWWGWMPWSSFFECWVLCQLFHSPLSLSLRGSSISTPEAFLIPLSVFSPPWGSPFIVFNNVVWQGASSIYSILFPLYIYIF